MASGSSSESDATPATTVSGRGAMQGAYWQTQRHSVGKGAAALTLHPHPQKARLYLYGLVGIGTDTQEPLSRCGGARPKAIRLEPSCCLPNSFKNLAPSCCCFVCAKVSPSHGEAWEAAAGAETDFFTVANYGYFVDRIITGPFAPLLHQQP